MKAKKKYPPLELLEAVTMEIPDAWTILKKLHDENGQGGISWDSRCYIPIGATLALVAEKFDNLDSAKAAQLAALAPWRISKEVFVMDPELEKTLYEQADEKLDIPSEALLNLPYQCFYVEITQMEGIKGFFAHIEDDVNTGEKELRLLVIYDDGRTAAVPIHLSAKTIEENLGVVYQIAQENAKNGGYSEDYRNWLLEIQEKIRDKYGKMVACLLQIVLYLCSVNSEISAHSEQAFITKRTSHIKDRYAEIRKWNVGIRTGAAIKKQRLQISTQGGSGTHSSPRIHTRRGHWHHFWTGQRGSEERKLVLRWVAPTVVGIPENEETPIVLHFTEKSPKA